MKLPSSAFMRPRVASRWVQQNQLVLEQRRNISPDLKDKIGTIKRQRAPSDAVLDATSPTSSPVIAAKPPGEWGTHGPLSLEDSVEMVSYETKKKNVLLGSALLSFAFGVFIFSMNRVGQAGSGTGDPLSSLMKEAEEARIRHEQEDQEMKETAEMMQELQNDNDDLDLDDLDDPSPSKKPWYRFW